MDEKLFEKYVDTLSNQGLVNGLMLSQIICSRKLIEVTDKRSVDVVLAIMKEISESISDIQTSSKDVT
jgi:hypothetical protein